MLPSAVTGVVTLIQRFGSAIDLDVHFHMLVLDGTERGPSVHIADGPGAGMG